VVLINITGTTFVPGHLKAQPLGLSNQWTNNCTKTTGQTVPVTVSQGKWDQRATDANQ